MDKHVLTCSPLSLLTPLFAISLSLYLTTARSIEILELVAQRPRSLDALPDALLRSYDGGAHCEPLLAGRLLWTPKLAVHPLLPHPILQLHNHFPIELHLWLNIFN